MNRMNLSQIGMDRYCANRIGTLFAKSDVDSNFFELNRIISLQIKLETLRTPQAKSPVSEVTAHLWIPCGLYACLPTGP